MTLISQSHFRLRDLVDEVRTAIMDNKRDIYIPDLRKKLGK